MTLGTLPPTDEGSKQWAIATDGVVWRLLTTPLHAGEGVQDEWNYFWAVS